MQGLVTLMEGKVVMGYLIRFLVRLLITLEGEVEEVILLLVVILPQVD
jgi:hypothetical protein